MTVAAIVGSRGFTNANLVNRVIRGLTAEGVVSIISGGAAGADTLARETCRRWGFHMCNEDPDPHGLDHLPLPHHFYEFRADWERYGKAAGFRRNETIVRHASMVIALYAPGPLTPGTTHTVRLARDAGLPVHVYHEGRWAA